jgi:alpha-tubulin suppressor-like RCC1 family protein
MIASSKDESSKSSKAVAFGRNYFHALAGGGGGSEAAAPAPTTGTATTTTTDSNKKPSLAALDESLISSAGKGAADNNRPLPWVDLSLDGDDEQSDVVQADASAQSTVFLTSSGKVYQTGTIHGHVYSSPTRVTIPLPLPAIQVSCGRHFCVALMRGGVVVSWGAGHFGQLGIGASADGGGLDNSASAADSQHASAAASLTFTATPVVVERLLPHIIGSPVLKLAAGDWHALALTQSGRVWAWGSNRSYQCGRKPSSSNTTAPTLTAPLPVPMDGTVADIAAGRSHSVALLSPGPSGSPLAGLSSLAPPIAGQVYAWGASQYGQCGILRRAGSGVVPPRMVEGLAEVTIERVAAAGNHNLALTSGGRVFGWGSSSEGELGLGTYNTYAIRDASRNSTVLSVLLRVVDFSF